MNILKFEHNGKEIDITVHKGKLAFIYETGSEGDDKFLQNAVSLKSRKTEDVVASAISLFINAIESIKEYENNRVSNTSTTEVPASNN